MPRSFPFRLIDLLVLGLGLLILMIIGVMAASQMREDANRIKCAQQLRAIGQSILLYTNENRGGYPRTTYVAGKPSRPTAGTGAAATQPFAADGPEPNDVTAALFLLVRTQDITMEVFCCPSSGHTPDPLGGTHGLNRCNFSDHRVNLSYSFQNLYADEGMRWGTPPWSSSVEAELALAADKNAGTKGRRDDVVGINITSPPRQMRKGNSNNHDKVGQNVLFTDGHVEWVDNLFVGVERDNIYTRARSEPAGRLQSAGSDGNSDREVPFGSPFHHFDSVLLPTDD